MSEQRAVADAVMHLVSQGLLPSNPATIRRLADVLQVPVRELRNAWDRLHRHGYRPPSSEVRLEDPPSVSVEHQRASRSTRRFAEANPTPGMRRCRRCGEVQPEGNFPIKDRASGRRRSYDHACWKAMQRERYISVSKEKALNAVGIAFILTEADDLGRSLCCMDCGVPLKPGDHVEGRRVTLRHVDCDEAQLSWLHRRTA